MCAEPIDPDNSAVMAGGKGGRAGWAKVGMGTSVIVSTITIKLKKE